LAACGGNGEPSGAEASPGDQVTDELGSETANGEGQLASIRIEPAQPASGQEVRLDIRNLSGVEMSYGLEYRLERRERDAWLEVDPDLEATFPANGILIPPRGSEVQEIQLPVSEPGTYRICKDLASLDSESVEVVEVCETFLLS